MLKNDKEYYAKVIGSLDRPYDVYINLDEEDLVLKCNCPCEENCKHEYAVLMAIKNQEYEIGKVLPKIEEKAFNLESVIEAIPAEKIKQYLLSPLGKEKVCFEITAFKEYFCKYLSKQDYEYYYNNLYNSLVLETDFEKLVNNYLKIINNYLANLELVEAFKIIKSIIEAYNKANKLNFDNYIIDIFPKLEMFLRIIVRKTDSQLKEDIENWFKIVRENNYYNNFYLEDLVMMVQELF